MRGKSCIFKTQVHVAEQRQCIDQTGQRTRHLRIGKGIPDLEARWVTRLRPGLNDTQIRM